MGCFGKQWVFLKQCFLTRLHTWFIFILKHMHFIKIKAIHGLHKISFHNTSPHRSQSYRPYYSRTLINSHVLHFSTLKLLLFSCRKSLRFFSAHILKLCVFPPKYAWKMQNADQTLLLDRPHSLAYEIFVSFDSILIIMLKTYCSFI